MEGRKYILFADDDEDDQYLFRSAFEEIDSSIELVFVNNGIELMQHFKQVEQGEIPGPPLLMVLDINIPIKNGKDTVRNILERKNVREIPTVILATTACEFEQKKRNELGTHECFVKPGDYKTLIEILSQIRSIADRDIALHSVPVNR